MKLSVIVSVLLLSLSCGVCEGAVYYNDFSEGNASLSDFSTGGNGNVQVQTGEMLVSINDRYGTVWSSLHSSAFAAPYSSSLSNNPGLITWAFNISNQDDIVNNGFHVVLACDQLMPYLTSTHGYEFKGGSMVGNRFFLKRMDYETGGGGRILIDAPNPNGLGTLPDRGSIKITFDPATSEWNLYAVTGSTYQNPIMVTRHIGSAIDSTYTSLSLPYFSVLGVGSGKVYFDNLSINVVPEPSLAIIMVGLLGAALRRQP